MTVDPENNLGLTFVLSVHGKGIKGQGTLLPGSKFPQPLKAALPFLGKPDKEGRYRLSF